MDFSKLTVVRCSVDQARKTRQNHFSTWGAPLGFVQDDWVHRFEVLEGEEWADGDRYESWALVPRDDMETLDLLAHCETFRRPSIALAPHAKTPKEVLSYGIAGVFTPQHQRAHGYARQLLRLLHYIIAPHDLLPPYPTAWGPPPKITGLKDASFSVLYSGVGDKYYTSCRRGDGPDSLPGWEKIFVTDRTWKVPPAAQDADYSSWGQWVAPGDLHALEQRASETMKRDLATMDEDKHRVAILPSEALFRVHAVRNQQAPSYFAAKDRTFGLVLSPEKMTGDANSNGDSPSDRPFIVYTFPESTKNPPKLQVLYVQHPFPFEAVVAAAQKEGCTEIKMWNGRGGWDEHNPKMDKDAELPCMVVYDHPTDQTTWEYVEEYTWC